MRRFSQRQALLLTTLLTAALTVLPAVAAPADTSCPRPANRPVKAGGKADDKTKESSGKKSIALKPENASETINFGGTRGTRSVDVVLLASKPLPTTFSAKQLELDSPRRFQRVGPTLDTASLRLPRFSNPQILEHRKKIRLRVCVDTTEAQAGTYSGAVYVSGPPGIGSTSVTVTANVKTSEGLFWLFLILALIAALLLLLFKAAKEQKEKEDAEGARRNKKIERNPNGEEKYVPSWKRAAGSRFRDLTFLVSTVIALGAAFVAMRAIYDGNPAWGTETWTNVFALCGTAFGAAGIGTLITAFTPKAS